MLNRGHQHQCAILKQPSHHAQEQRIEGASVADGLLTLEQIPVSNPDTSLPVIEGIVFQGRRPGGKRQTMFCQGEREKYRQNNPEVTIGNPVEHDRHLRTAVNRSGCLCAFRDVPLFSRAPVRPVACKGTL
jgi:hypothetical protein